MPLLRGPYNARPPAGAAPRSGGCRRKRAGLELLLRNPLFFLIFAVRVSQKFYRATLGEEYRDYDLVIAQINGRPYEQRIIDKMFYKLIEENSLRPVVFHSLRHSSTSLKLKLSKGNIKAVQGDTGHAEARMVTDTYAHGFDADRKLIAQEMDSGFFSKVGADQKPAEADSATVDLLKQLVRQHPELLTELLKEANGERK